MRSSVLLVVVFASALATAGTAASRQACTPGTFTSGGSSGVTFCGPAKATVKVGGKTYVFSGGSCTRTSQYVNLNMAPRS